MDRMRILTNQGVVDTLVSDSGTASTVGHYWNAVRHYLWTGNTGRLQPFEGRSINSHRLLTDPDRIDEWARVGEIELNSIYETGGS